MTIKVPSEYEVMPAYVKWTRNYYVLVGMVVLCTYSLIVELSRQHPEEIRTPWAMAYVMMIAYWLYQVRLRRRMDRTARLATEGFNKALGDASDDS